MSSTSVFGGFVFGRRPGKPGACLLAEASLHTRAGPFREAGLFGYLHLAYHPPISFNCQVGQLLKETMDSHENASVVPDEGLEFQDQESISQSFWCPVPWRRCEARGFFARPALESKVSTSSLCVEKYRDS
mmetsp:Transcript_50007/g.104079  ORF Transcript_50007/g.104079 Transcript_50007/m.104079 type:complete len:131 (+) Transcript_50007:236-628(+)